MERAFVPDDLEPPTGLELPGMRLEPLGPQHNERDHEAWSSSMDHIRATPGFDRDQGDEVWPRPMTLEENRSDLERHASDFEARRGFTYTVLDPSSDEVIGCVYIYPASDDEHDARVTSWVRASRAELDAPLRRGVAEWLASEWPFENVSAEAASPDP
jgi:hypothetical protein